MYHLLDNDLLGKEKFSKQHTKVSPFANISCKHLIEKLVATGILFISAVKIALNVKL